MNFLCGCELNPGQHGQLRACGSLNHSGHVCAGVVIRNRDQVGISLEGAFYNEGWQHLQRGTWGEHGVDMEFCLKAFHSLGSVSVMPSCQSFPTTW